VRTLSRDEAMAVLENERQRAGHACVMCALASPAYDTHLLIAENEYAVLRLNVLGSRAADMLVVLKAHVTTMGALPFAAYQGMHELAFAAARALEAHRGALRVYIAQLGAPELLAMSYPHLHLHVVPIYQAGESEKPARVLSWTHGVVSYEPDEARVLAQELRALITREQRAVP